MLAPHLIVVKGFVEGWTLYRDNGETYNLLNGYAMSDTREHGFFQIQEVRGYWRIHRKVITDVERLNR